MQSTSCEMPGWMSHKLQQIALSDMNNCQYTDDATLMVESEQETKELLDEGERGE